MFFSDEPVTDFASAGRSDGKLFSAWFNGMLDEGIYLAPSPFETCFVSTAHTDEVIQQTVEAASEVMRRLAETGKG